MRTYIIAILLFAALLAGCISTDVQHVQHADGSADISQSTDLSILESAYGSGSTYGSTLSTAFSEMCSGYGTKVQCEVKDGTLTLAKTYTPDDSFYKFEVQDQLLVKRYRLTVDELPDFGSFANSTSPSIFGDEYDTGTPYSDSAIDSYSDSYGGGSYGMYGEYFGSAEEGLRLTSAKGKSTGTLLKQVGMEYTYTVRMPGKITEAEGAVELNDSQATFDVIQQLQDRKPIVVVSEEINWLVVGIVGIIIVFAVLSIAVAVLLMVKPKPKQVS